MNTPCPVELSCESGAMHADPDGPGAAGAYASQELGSGALVRRSRRVKAAATDATAEVRFDRALNTALCTLLDVAVCAICCTDASWRCSQPDSNSICIAHCSALRATQCCAVRQRPSHTTRSFRPAYGHSSS